MVVYQKREIIFVFGLMFSTNCFSSDDEWFPDEWFPSAQVISPKAEQDLDSWSPGQSNDSEKDEFFGEEISESNLQFRKDVLISGVRHHSKYTQAEYEDFLRSSPIAGTPYVDTVQQTRLVKESEYYGQVVNGSIENFSTKKDYKLTLLVTAIAEEQKKSAIAKLLTSHKREKTIEQEYDLGWLHRGESKEFSIFVSTNTEAKSIWRGEIPRSKVEYTIVSESISVIPIYTNTLEYRN